MDLGQLLADWIDPTILAIEDALNEGVYGRGPIELVTADARGLPRENYRKVRDGYRWLVEQGCVVVLGPMISDNSLDAAATSSTRPASPCIGWTGAHRFVGDYCFTVANGDIPTEGVMCAQLAAASRATTKVGLFWEQGSSGRDYADYFRDTAHAARPRRSSREVTLEPEPARPEGRPRRRCASMGAEGDLLRRLRLLDVPLRRGVQRRSTGTRRASWAPRSCSIRTRTRGPRGSRAGTASTSSARTAPNPNYDAMIERFEARFGRVTRNVVVALAYDTARAAHPRHRQRRSSPTPDEVKDGLETIRWMPAPTAAPAPTCSSRPYDHKGYKGDFLTIRELRGGELRFHGYYRPKWPSNTTSPLLAP